MALAAVAAGLALLVSGLRGPVEPGGRDQALASALTKRGLVPDAASVVWLDQPPFGALEAASKRALAVLRAAPGE